MTKFVFTLPTSTAPLDLPLPKQYDLQFLHIIDVPQILAYKIYDTKSNMSSIFYVLASLSIKAIKVSPF